MVVGVTGIRTLWGRYHAGQSSGVHRTYLREGKGGDESRHPQLGRANSWRGELKKFSLIYRKRGGRNNILSGGSKFLATPLGVSAVSEPEWGQAGRRIGDRALSYNHVKPKALQSFRLPDC